MEYLNFFIAALALILLTLKSKKMDSKVQELELAIDEMNAAAIEEKKQVSEKIGGLEQSVAALEEQVANGGSAETLQALINKVKDGTKAIREIFPAPGEDTTTEQ